MNFSIVVRLVRSPAPPVLGLAVGRLLLVTIAFTALCVVAQSLTPLSLPETLKLAQARSPQLAAQSAAIGAAESLIVSAGQRPDPQLGIGVENLPINGPDAFSVGRDFMTMRKIGVSQQFTRSEKLHARGAKAVAERQREQAKLLSTETDLRRDVALTWLDRYFIEQRLRVLRDLERETALLAEAARAALAGGKGSPADPIIARTASVQVQDRIQEIDRDLKGAQASLARYVGDTESARPLAKPPSFYTLPHAPNEFLRVLEHHPQLLMYEPMEAMARADIAEAQAAKKPDWSLELAYAQRGSSFSNMVTIQARIDLPIFSKKRQDPVIAARYKALEQVQAEREEARRMHEAEIKRMLADWETARARLKRYWEELVPLSREAAAAALAAYRSGRGNLAAALDARRTAVETRFADVQTQAELARAWANLNFLVSESAPRKVVK
jgi:outer membrane protein, heavy metal efflux system